MDWTMSRDDPTCSGLIRAAGTEIFGHTVELTKLTSIREDLGEGRLQEHCTFSVHFPDLDDTDLPTPLQRHLLTRHLAMRTTLRVPQGKEASITLTGRQFCRTFPYHVFFDDSLTILQCGEALRRLLPAGIGPGTKMGDVFTVQYPRMGWSVDNVKRFTNTIFMLSIKPRNGSTRKTLNIKGARTSCNQS
ncbi:hypothetical protein C0Q70_15835 [Pomacea canaliculata]|uniref:guanylate cyclase n=1 Tax=Pomacea canaliculata TaxID=400727 RepID=A0A2T7NW01_POMCA|nr:hypothetical protein C0Q70_15835 [Pomacea canaliculata]